MTETTEPRGWKPETTAAERARWAARVRETGPDRIAGFSVMVVRRLLRDLAAAMQEIERLRDTAETAERERDEAKAKALAAAHRLASMTADEIRLHFGELTAMEMRSVKAALAYAAGTIRVLAKPESSE